MDATFNFPNSTISAVQQTSFVHVKATTSATTTHMATFDFPIYFIIIARGSRIGIYSDGGTLPGWADLGFNFSTDRKSLLLIYFNQKAAYDIFAALETN